MQRTDGSDYRSPEGFSSGVDIETRLMLTFALLGSFTFGFIFFGDAPTILGLLVLFGPSDGANLLPKVLGIVGLLSLVGSLYWRESDGWRPVMIVGASALFSSWLLFFHIVGGNLMTFLGTAPFLFFSLWFLTDTVRAIRTTFRGREEKTEELLSVEPAPIRIRFAGLLDGLIAPLRRWLRVEEETPKKGDTRGFPHAL